MMISEAREILRVITIVFLTLLCLGCLVRVANKKGTWADAILIIMSVPSWLFAVCA